jgi:hypothetical protein
VTIYRDDLERVYKLIERPESWLRRKFNNTDRDPTCFCVAGAYLYVVGVQPQATDSACSSLPLFAMALGFDGPIPVLDLFQFNDTRTHADVLALLRDAITLAPVRP